MALPPLVTPDHCRSACAMVCKELDWSIGAENHATTLLSFGCCSGSPLMMKQEGEGREMQLYQLAGDGARRRLLASSGGELRDRHSLSADYSELLKDEKAMQKRVAKLGPSKMLPYQGQQLVTTLKTKDQFGEKPDRQWSDHGRKCTGKDCPDSSAGAEASAAAKKALASVGRSGSVIVQSPYRAHRLANNLARQRNRNSKQGILELSHPPEKELEDMQDPSDANPADFDEPTYEAFIEQHKENSRDIYREYQRCLGKRTRDECLAMIKKEREGWEYRTYNYTSSDEPVPRYVESQWGDGVARGRISADDLSRELTGGHRPTQRGISEYLGARLYRVYRRERRERRTYGRAHRILRRGIARVKRAYRFRRAYGKSEYEWCLERHKWDDDFPQKCLGTRDRIGRPYQERHKPWTEPEKILNGWIDGMYDLIGEDHHQLVNKAGEEGGLKHTNEFVDGAVKVNPVRYVTGDPAPWEKIRLVRDRPQVLEHKVLYARDSAKLPGVNVDGFDASIPAQYQDSNAHSLGVTPRVCCAKFVDSVDE